MTSAPRSIQRPRRFGAQPLPEGGCQLLMIADRQEAVEVVLHPNSDRQARIPLTRRDDGTHEGHVDGLRVGDRYGFSWPGHDRVYPDPASAYQPEGVHGVSEVCDIHGYAWQDRSWRAPDFDATPVYELHIGAFTSEGTFKAAGQRLEILADLGVQRIEVMPVAATPGRWNWGYDGVSLFATQASYGRPEELMSLVDQAHQLGIAVILDVVYNHFGPDGNYLGVWSEAFESPIHTNPWGASLNFDAPGSRLVREFFLDNAIRWVEDFHLDGLRLDATHAIPDDSSLHFLAELSEQIRASVPDRQVYLIAEDHRNLVHMVKPRSADGWGLDAVWADDWHHQMRRCLTGDQRGYFQDFAGTSEAIARTLVQGWTFQGEHSQHLGESRGTKPGSTPYERFVICLQNHDQVGNRPMGDRLHHVTSLDAYRAASVLLLTAPETPLLWMGQEWAATSPFQYFTDHNPELGRLVTEGRRNEFAYFPEFTDPQAREAIPDPQAEATFQRSKLDWSEREQSHHRGIFDLYRDLLALRKSLPQLRCTDRQHFQAKEMGEGVVALCRTGVDDHQQSVWVVASLIGATEVPIADLPSGAQLNRSTGTIRVRLQTETPDYVETPMPIELRDEATFVFSRPSAILFTLDA